MQSSFRGTRSVVLTHGTIAAKRTARLAKEVRRCAPGDQHAWPPMQADAHSDVALAKSTLLGPLPEGGPNPERDRGDS